jgi:hypothetical protein
LSRRNENEKKKIRKDLEQRDAKTAKEYEDKEHNWLFIAEIERWIHIPKSNLNSRAPRPLIDAQFERLIDLLQDAKDRLVIAQRELDKK